MCCFLDSYRDARSHVKRPLGQWMHLFHECVKDQPTDQWSDPLIGMRGRIQKDKYKFWLNKMPVRNKAFFFAHQLVTNMHLG